VGSDLVPIGRVGKPHGLDGGFFVDGASERKGVFAQGTGFPTVARDKARVRTIVTATHTRDELQFALDSFAAAGRSLGVI